MGYATEVVGVLKFTHELTIFQLKKLIYFLEGDPRDHPEWLRDNRCTYSYLQWMITEDYEGITWDGSEKFYYIVEGVNLILLNMRDQFPDFGFTGELECQGEEMDDRWRLVIRDGKAVRIDIRPEGEVYRCPHCGEEFRPAEKDKVK